MIQQHIHQFSGGHDNDILHIAYSQKTQLNSYVKTAGFSHLINLITTVF